LADNSDTTYCDHCAQEHRYVCFEKVAEGDVRWFCSELCRPYFMLTRAGKASLREFMPTGGFQ
jgi:hypothetical protein